LQKKLCDAVILVGKSDRTKGLSEGVTGQEKVTLDRFNKRFISCLKTLNLKTRGASGNDLPNKLLDFQSNFSPEIVMLVGTTGSILFAILVSFKRKINKVLSEVP